MTSQLLMNTTYGGEVDAYYSIVHPHVPWAACSRILTWMILPIVFISLYCVYQVYFHPLARYPGPFVAKFTILRAAYHAWKGDIHLDMFHCHQKYGPIVRYAPDFVLFDTSSAIKDIYGLKSNTWKHRQFAALSPKATTLFTVYDKNEHARRRRLLGPSFNDTSVQQFEDKLVEHTLTLCKQLYPPQGQRDESSNWGPAMNMTDWCTYFAFDNMSEFLFGASSNLMECDRWRHMIPDIIDHSLRNAVIVWLPMLIIGRLDRLLFPESVHGTKQLWKWVGHVVEQRNKLDVTEGVLSRLTGLKDKETGTSLTDQQIQSELGIFVVAGMDTTATAMAALLFYLSRDRRVYERLATEIRSSFDTIGEIRHGQQLKSCTYLQACINETMRMTPSVGACPWRQVGPEGAYIDGHFIPEGYSVGSAIYTIHHNETYFSDPHKFIPERWLPDADVLATKSAFHPFASGARACIGRPLAHAELLFMSAIVIWKYDFRVASRVNSKLGGGRIPCDGEAAIGRANPHEFQLRDRIISISEGPLLQFKPRKFE